MSPERKRWKYAEHAKAFHQGHGFAPYVMDFKGCLEASAEDDTLSKKARQILDGLKLFEWGNLSDAPVDAMPAVEPTDPQPRALTQAEIAARLGISASTFSEGCSELRAKGFLPANSTSLKLVDRRVHRPATDRAPQNSDKMSAESNSDSANSSPYLLFKAMYYSGHPELIAKIGRQRAEINRLEKELSAERAKLRALDRKVLAAWRDHQRHGGVDSTNGNGRTSMESDSNSALNPIVDSGGVDSRFHEESNRTPQRPIRTPPAETGANPSDISTAVGVLVEHVEISESPESRQADSSGISASRPAGLDSVPSKLAELRSVFPSEFLPDEKLEWVDRQVVSLLGDDYSRSELVYFVSARQRPGAPIRAGLVFNWEHGIAREFCRKVLQDRRNMPSSRKPATVECPQCSDTGLVGGNVWTTIPELKAVDSPTFCECEQGIVARELYCGEANGNGRVRGSLEALSGP